MRERFKLDALGALLSRPTIAFALGIAIIGEFVWQAAASFLPIFLIEHAGCSSSVAALGFSAYFVSQGVAQVGVGWVSDRFGRDRSTAGCLLLGAVGIALLVRESAVVLVALGIVLLGIGMSFEAALLPRMLSDLSVEERATGFGLLRTIYVITASLGSVVVGLIADTFGWGASFGFLAALLLVAFVGFVLEWLLSRND